MLAIGDDTTLGWTTVALYGVATVLTFARALRAGERRDRMFWFLLCLIMLGLGVNKQADLQSDLIRIGRELVKAANLYDVRRTVQLFLFAGLSAAGLALLATLVRLRVQGADGSLALAGLATVLLYVFVRAGHAHHLLGDKAASTAAHLIEPFGLLLLLCGANFGRTRFSRKARPAWSADRQGRRCNPP